jgi:hypothetical protein
VEGIKVRGEGGSDGESSEDDDDDDDDDEVAGLKRPGRTFLLREGQMRLLTKGVESYVATVEKKLKM